MKNLNLDCKNIENIVSKNSRILLALDFDGTLTPIMPCPQDVVLNAELRKILSKLSQKQKYCVAVISGRSLKDVKNLVKIKGLIYSGNHGFEIKGPKIKFLHPAYKNFRPYIKDIKFELLKKVKGVKGCLLEDKIVTLSLHYRLVGSKEIPFLKKAIKESACAFRKKIKVTQGKKVFEIRPRLNWDKGKALKTIAKLIKKKQNDLTIYIGDDKTDNDAFKVMGKKDISIFVGKDKNSSAKYFLKDTVQVRNFLKRLLKLGG